MDREKNSNDSFVNPRSVLAQVTNLSVQLKKGQKQTLAWVTRLSDGQPAAGALVEIYNCLGNKVLSTPADSSGLARFDNQTWATDCGADQQSYSSYSSADGFFAVARFGQDFTFTHSSWFLRTPMPTVHRRGLCQLKCSRQRSLLSQHRGRESG